MTHFKGAATVLLATFVSAGCGGSTPAAKTPVAPVASANATPGDRAVPDYPQAGLDSNGVPANEYAASAWPHIPDRAN